MTLIVGSCFAGGVGWGALMRTQCQDQGIPQPLARELAVSTQTVFQLIGCWKMKITSLYLLENSLYAQSRIHIC